VDICAANQLSVPSISEGDKQALQERLSPSIRGIASLENPLDLTGSAVDEDFVASVEMLGKTPHVDCIIILLLPYLPGITLDLGARLSYLYQEYRKPLIAYVPHVEKFRMLIEGFEFNGIPVSPSIEGAVYMADAMRRCQPC
jgi:acyl-CoA synthetase (NDP forming)